MGYLRGFKLGRFLIKANTPFAAVLGFLSIFTDWSYWADDLREAVRQKPYAIFIIWAAWNILLFLHEMMRVTLRNDLEDVRRENRQKRQARRQKR